MKHGPAQIIGLCEVEAETEQVLSSAAVAADEGDRESLAGRLGHSYYCIRGNEEKSNMLAIRTETGSPRILFWERKEEGTYNVSHSGKSTGGPRKAVAYSRTLVCAAST